MSIVINLCISRFIHYFYNRTHRQSYYLRKKHNKIIVVEGKTFILSDMPKYL